jgi:hypothetical protein
MRQICQCLPDTFQMHWANLHYMSHLFALENSITSTSSHACNIKKLRTVDHMVICAVISVLL